MLPFPFFLIIIIFVYVTAIEVNAWDGLEMKKGEGYECYEYPEGLDDHDLYHAYGCFNNTLDSIGWGMLSLQTNPSTTNIDDKDLMFAAGYVEGYLTGERIWEFAHSVAGFFFEGQPEPFVPSPYLKGFLDKQQKWMDDQITLNAANDPYWRSIQLIQAQFDGLYAGYVQYANWAVERRALPRFALQMIQLTGDLLDLMSLWEEGWAIDLSNSTPEEVEMFILTHSHCSAFIKAKSDLSDLFVAHTAWFTYGAMNRIYKHYTLNLPSFPHAAARKMSFSSYSGMLESLDDFFMMDSGLVMTQTTNSVFNRSLYSEVSPYSNFAWMRVRAANLMAHTGRQWYDIVSKYNSGTYNNQYMIINYGIFSPGQALPPGLLWVIEQIPGYLEGQDVTHELKNGFGYFPSYNIPYFKTIFNISGYPDMVNQTGDSNSYEKCPRANIFRREAPGINSVEAMQMLIRSNDFHNDPLSEGKPTHAICARADLRTSGPSMPFGCMDGKVTSYEMHSRMAAMIISSPSTGDGGKLPYFEWTDAFNKTAHPGQPTLWDFNWMETVSQSIRRDSKDKKDDEPLSTGTIVIIVCGCTALLAGVFIFVWMRRRKSNEESTAFARL